MTALHLPRQSKNEEIFVSSSLFSDRTQNTGIEAKIKHHVQITRKINK